MQSPAVPSATATAAAQTASNQQTATTQTELNAINQNTPSGSLSYSQNGTWPDGTPKFTSTTSLTPQGQQLYSTEQGVQQNLAGAGQNFTGAAAGTLSSPVNTSGVPSLGTAPNLSSYGSGPSLQTSLPSDYSGDRQSAIDSLTALQQPMLDREQTSLQQNLANQGLKPGSEAYDNAMNDFGTQENNAQQQIIANSGQEQSLEQSLGLNAANLNNSNTQQMYANQTAAGQLNNTNAQNNFSNQNTANQLGLQNSYNGYNQNLNEALSLAGLQQVNSPSFTSTPSSGVSPTDVSGLINTQYNQQAAQTAGTNSALGSIASTVGGWLFSDERLKTDIQPTGMKTADNIPVKTFRYKGSPLLQMGVIAQDVQKKMPSAVRTTPSGFKAVDYDKIGSPMLRMGAR